MFGLADRFDKPTAYSPGPGHYESKSVFGTQGSSDLTTQLVQKLYQLPNDPLNLTSISVRSTRSTHFDDSLAARIARLETSLNCNRTSACAPGRRRGGGPSGVLATSHTEFESAQDAGFQRHSWLAGELSGDVFCFKSTNTPANIGPGAYCSPESVAPERIPARSHNYLIQRSEEIARNRRDLWVQRRMQTMSSATLKGALMGSGLSRSAGFFGFPPLGSVEPGLDRSEIVGVGGEGGFAQGGSGISGQQAPHSGVATQLPSASDGYDSGAVYPPEGSSGLRGGEQQHTSTGANASTSLAGGGAGASTAGHNPAAPKIPQSYSQNPSVAGGGGATMGGGASGSNVLYYAEPGAAANYSVQIGEASVKEASLAQRGAAAAGGAGQGVGPNSSQLGYNSISVQMGMGHEQQGPLHNPQQEPGHDVAPQSGARQHPGAGPESSVQQSIDEQLAAGLSAMPGQGGRSASVQFSIGGANEQQAGVSGQQQQQAGTTTKNPFSYGSRADQELVGNLVQQYHRATSSTVQQSRPLFTQQQHGPTASSSSTAPFPQAQTQGQHPRLYPNGILQNRVRPNKAHLRATAGSYAAPQQQLQQLQQHYQAGPVPAGAAHVNVGVAASGAPSAPQVQHSLQPHYRTGALYSYIHQPATAAGMGPLVNRRVTAPHMFAPAARGLRPAMR